jgi:hypothetical protein
MEVDMKTVRPIGLDTYYGEGLFYPEAYSWDFIIVKISHNRLAYLSKNYISDKTKKIIEAILESDIPVVGAYHYLTGNNAKNPWHKQADTYLEAIRYIKDVMGLTIDFDVPDIEGKGAKIFNPKKLKWVYPAKHGAMAYEWVEFMKAERKKPVIPYMSSSTIVECFLWHGYDKFIKNIDLWIAQYPYKGWNEDNREIPNDPVRWKPFVTPQIDPERVVIWQFTDSWPPNGVTDSKAIDVNVWLKGSRADMLKYFGKDTDEPEPPAPPDPSPIDEQAIRRDERNKVVDEAKDRIEGLRV